MRLAGIAFTATLLLAVQATAAERIVSIGGAVTEILFALGLGDRIIAVDTTSLYPEAALALPKVGYMRTLAAEPIVALAPDLVVTVDHAGPRQVLDQVAAAGFSVAVVSDGYDAPGVIRKIEEVAAAVGEEEAGAALIGKVGADLDRVAAVVQRAPTHPSVLFILTASSGAPLAAGTKTAADGIIALAGGTNAVQGYEGYKPLSPEAAIDIDPDLVLISEHGLALLGGLEGLAARPDLGLLPAVRDGRVMVMEANYLLGFGPRAAEAAAELAQRLHPTLAAELAQ